jgi:hypothetical protein
MLSSIINRQQDDNARAALSSPVRAGGQFRRGAGALDVWARPGMAVTFRAELMPGRVSAERTFRVTRVLPSLRVLIEGIAGEHAASEFEAV